MLANDTIIPAKMPAATAAKPCIYTATAATVGIIISRN